MRKLLSIAALVGGALVVGRLLGVGASGPVPLEIHYLLGDPPICTALEVQATPAGRDEPAARFETSLVAPEVIHKTRLPAGDERLEITLVSAHGRRTVARTIDAARGAVVRLDLSREGVP